MKLNLILQQLRDKHQYRSLEAFDAAGGKLTDKLLNFCANDYLNLAQHPEVKQAAIYAIQHYGCSAASSRLLSGHLEIHQELECQLARWSGCYEAALCFGSGYLANCGILQAVLEPNSLVLFDRLNHASLVDGLRLAQAQSHSSFQIEKPLARGLEWQRYKHGNLEDLENRLLSSRQEQPQRSIWLVTDSVFSMDGDLAPLLQLSLLSQKYQFRWIVDEAHGVGIYGPTGAGLVQALDLNLRENPQNFGAGRLPDFVTANLAKALGSYGGYCLCSAEWKDYLINFCRSLIYSTGLPPSCAAAALASIKIIQQESGHAPALVPANTTSLSLELQNDSHLACGLGLQLLKRSTLFYQELKQVLAGFAELPNQALRPLYSPIVPLILGENDIALATAEQLRQSDIVVKAIRSPTVPPSTARLRFSLSLAHSETELRHCAQALSSVLTQIFGRS